MEFASLHHHSTYSFLDGFGTPDAHVQRAAELGYTAMALTEHGLP
jgi:DNA polymerase-3 subunit alpha